MCGRVCGVALTFWLRNQRSPGSSTATDREERKSKERTRHSHLCFSPRHTMMASHRIGLGSRPAHTFRGRFTPSSLPLFHSKAAAGQAACPLQKVAAGSPPVGGIGITSVLQGGLLATVVLLGAWGSTPAWAARTPEKTVGTVC